MTNLKLDPNFKPAVMVIRDFNERVKNEANEKLSIVIERNDGFNEVFTQNIFSNPAKMDENIFILERIIKSLLWVYGGYKIIVVGNKEVYARIKHIFMDGFRKFDKEFMERIYLEKFEVLHSDTLPEIKKGDEAIGKHLDGNRIGFDAGGSDMKVSAVKDGEVLFSEEIVWLPKLNSDPEYHKQHIRNAIMKAAKVLPKVDAIGVSSAGVYINNEARVASLFIQVPEELFDKHIRNIYIDVAKELNVPIIVANDGDVTALAGSMTLNKTKLLGIAMGTSEAAGYVNEKGNIEGWLNELAFVPVDFQENGPVDEWSGDFGTGNKYFSQDAVIRLAEKAGITFEENQTLAERLKVVQKLDKNDLRFVEIFETIGTYLAYGLAWYEYFYDISEVLLLGRVMSGEGGNIILKKANEVLKNVFPELKKKISISLPDEKFRRLGQSVAAASLVKLS